LILSEDFAGETVNCCRFGSWLPNLQTSNKSHKAHTTNNLQQKDFDFSFLARQLRLHMSQLDNKQAMACIKA
jgi:hypothetical protein